MRSKLSTLLVLALLPLLSFGQGASLTIFSEDGDKFILFLNGVRQNNNGQTNLRLDGLSQPYYKAKIVFDDKSKATIDKNLAVNDPATNAPADVVYRIKNKDGKMVLRYYSAQPIQPDYVPPADVYVIHYGQPDPGTTVTQTTVTQTTGTNTGNGGVSIGVNGGGVNMNINVNDPNYNGGVTQTTTTTTTTSSYSSSSTNYDNQPVAQPACQYPMNPGSFKSAKATVANASFEDTKYSTAQSILTGNCLNTDQVIQICQLFGFEETKLKFAKDAYNRTTDRNNYFKVSNVFSFDASKTDLNNYISGGR